MAKKEIEQKEIAGKKGAIAVARPQLPAMPEFMQGSRAEERGTQQLAQFVIPPRMMIIQEQSKNQELKNEFGTATCLIMPQKLCIAERPRNAKGIMEKYGNDFDIVPVFFYTEWVHWAPLDATGDKILGRTLQPDHIIAKRAKRKDTRKGEDGSSYVEHMNFVCVFEDWAEEINEPAIISFSRGEHKTGRGLAQLIQARKGHIWGCRFTACCETHGNAKGEWYGLRIDNHAENPWVSDKKQFEYYKSMHDALLEVHQQQRLSASYDVEAPSMPEDPGETDY